MMNLDVIRALQQGVDVQVKHGDAWKTHTAAYVNHSDLCHGEWRVKPAPHKYSREVYFNAKPVPTENWNDLHTFLFGKNYWLDSASQICNKKYLVTVEEIVSEE